MTHVALTHLVSRKCLDRWFRSFTVVFLWAKNKAAKSLIEGVKVAVGGKSRGGMRESISTWTETRGGRQAHIVRTQSGGGGGLEQQQVDGSLLVSHLIAGNNLSWDV